MLAGAALLPFALVWLVASAASDRLASGIARPLASAAEKIAELSAPPPPPEPLPPAPDADALLALRGDPLADPDPEPAPPAEAAPAPAKVTAEEPLPPPAGAFMSRKRVLAAAEAGIRPSGSPVPATSWRPAGLSLSGVGLLGIGLRDGDVMTRCGGAAASSDGACVGAATAALRSGAKAIGAEVWRGRQKILVTVELPELRREGAKDR